MAEFESKHRKNAKKSVGLSFIRVYNVWHRSIKTALALIGMTHPQFIVLASLGYLAQFHEEVKQVDVAENADIDVMTVSTIVKNLEKKGWISRAASAKDTRAKQLLLTSKGQEVLNQALPIVEEIDEAFFSKLGKDRETFHRSLYQLLDE